MYDQDPTSTADGNYLWCIEKQRILPDCVIGDKQGTIRSPKCTQVTHMDSFMCFECRSIPTIPSLRQRVLRRGDDESPHQGSKLSKVKNSYLTNPEKKQKLQAYRRVHRKQRNKLARTRKQLLRARGKLTEVHNIATEQAHRGDSIALSNTFKIAYGKGMLRNQEKTFGFVNNIIKNSKKKSKGKRYSKFTKSMYEVARIWGGWRMVKFLSANLDGPGEGTIKRFSSQDKNKIVEGDYQFKNVEEVKAMYQSLMQENDIKSVIVEQAEDETVIIKMSNSLIV